MLATDADLPDLAPGELVAFLDAGAYGMTAASNNGQPRPPSWWSPDGVARVARRRETWEDLLAAETGTGAPVAAVPRPGQPAGLVAVPWARHRSGGGCGSMADVLLDVSRVCRTAPPAVSHLTLHVRHAELMVIVGPSGCGKSTVCA